MSWTQIRGHDLPRRQFVAALKRGRLAHAYLFTGPRGVGKSLFARELAKALLCDSPGDSLEACDKCSSCKLIDAKRHPDLHVARRPEDKLELPIETVRELSGLLALKPARGGRKVAILDDADDLNDSSANCFLKTLEEPPPGSLLILVGSDAERQLATIVSRCQVIRFAPLPPADLDAVLAGAGIDDPKHREKLIRLAGGSAGQALALNDPELWAFRGKLLERLASPMPDTVAIARDWTRFCDDAGKDAAAKRHRAALVLRLLIGMLESALKRAVGEALAEDPGEDRLLGELASRFGPDGLLAWLDRCFEADAQIDRRVQLVLILESLMDSLARS